MAPNPRAGRHRRRGVVALCATAAFAVALVGALASPAGAHATLLETTPTDDALLDTAPSEVTLTFDEPVEVSDDTLQVLDADGERVDDGPATTRDGGAVVVVPIDGGGRGTYTVAWRVLSEDGHNLTGSFLFHVGDRTGAVDIDDDKDALVSAVAGVGRWGVLAATIVVLGASVLAAVARDQAALRARLRRLVILSGVLGVIAGVLLTVGQVAEQSGRSVGGALSVLDRAVDTRTGVITLWRIGFLALAAVLAAIPVVWQRSPAAPAAAAVAAAAWAAASGHAWTVDERWLAVGADLVHLTAVGVWVGGLVALAVGLPVATDREGAVRRFSIAALVCAVIVGLTGVLSAVLQIRSWDALTTTGYGQLVLAKGAGFAVLVGFGYLNRSRLIPRIQKALAALVTSIRAEVAVAALLVAVTAALINQPPARASYSTPADTSVDTETLTIQLDVTPGRTGPNDLHLYFFEPGGTEAATVDAVEMTAAVADIPPRRLTVTPITPTHVSALQATLTSPGTWTIEVTAVHEGQATTATFEVPIR